MSRVPAGCVLLLSAACGGAEGVPDSGSLATVFDSTADTVTARIDGDLPIDTAHELEQIDIARIDHPIDTRVGIVLPQQRGDRDAVHDVPERAEPDDQKLVVHRRGWPIF